MDKIQVQKKIENFLLEYIEEKDNRLLVGALIDCAGEILDQEAKENRDIWDAVPTDDYILVNSKRSSDALAWRNN